MVNVLFLCTGNSCRSQMAEGWLRHLASDRFNVQSAGLDPSQINPLAVDAMREVGIDISGQRSKNVTSFLGQHFPYIITVCDRARDACPIFPGVCIREHWPIADPAKSEGSYEERMKAFRNARDDISKHMHQFIETHSQRVTMHTARRTY